MSKKKFRAAKRQDSSKPARSMSILRFGKPEPVLTTGTDYRDVWYDNDAEHYTLPIDRLALAQLINLNGQHGGIIHARKNMVLADYSLTGYRPHAGRSGQRAKLHVSWRRVIDGNGWLTINLTQQAIKNPGILGVVSDRYKLRKR